MSPHSLQSGQDHLPTRGGSEQFHSAMDLRSVLNTVQTFGKFVDVSLE